MIINKKVNDIKILLKGRAIKKGIIKYPEIYNIFEKGTSQNDVWDTFEEACQNLADSKDAIYGALMSNKDNIPNDGFFDIYHNKRREKYEEIANDKIIQDLTLEEKIKMTDNERNIVYTHV